MSLWKTFSHLLICIDAKGIIISISDCQSQTISSSVNETIGETGFGPLKVETIFEKTVKWFGCH
jgi:hypothetical protein